MRCSRSVAGEFIVTTDRLCETRWLRRVVDCLADFKRANTSNALIALRDRLGALAVADDAPRVLTFASGGDEFRRHPIASVESLDCSALLMYWPAGHATLPHDHAGLWGIEVVVDGRLDVDEYMKSGPADEPVLTFVRSLSLAAGDAAVFTSEQYVHRCRNRSNTSATLTLHIYGGVLASYTSFERDAEGRIVPALRMTANNRALS
jgi:hypothetical protein